MQDRLRCPRGEVRELEGLPEERRERQRHPSPRDRPDAQQHLARQDQPEPDGCSEAQSGALSTVLLYDGGVGTALLRPIARRDRADAPRPRRHGQRGSRLRKRRAEQDRGGMQARDGGLQQVSTELPRR